MEHIDVEKKIHKIRQALSNELKQANAIDENGKSINDELFDRIIDAKINEINQLEPMVVDEMGVARDRYAANIFMYQIQLLNEMKKNHSLVKEPELPEHDVAIERANQPSKRQKFLNGIRNVMNKFSIRKRGNEYSK
ncbi:MAG: hypothetical protein ACLRFP_02100 [Alphaproteobacteria bacterium]